ncbi:MAG: hypothetical protein JXA20_07325 [Spirochaetes bacterium]|nr:hypothetical protein [Spirochaetota bacterium]
MLTIVLHEKIRASVWISEQGMYENNDITFLVAYNHGNSTPIQGKDGKVLWSFFNDVSFQITAKEGCSIHDETHVVFNDRPWVFKAQNVDNSFYHQGHIEMNNTILTDGSIIKLVYRISEKGSADVHSIRSVTKVFRAKREKDEGTRNKKLILEEMQ